MENNYDELINSNINTPEKPKDKSNYSIDMHWNQLQKSDIGNIYVDYKNLFKIKNIKINKYLYDIQIININNINDIFNFDKFYLEYDYIIINYNSIKLCDKFIKITKEDLINNDYELIQLQYTCNLDEFNKNIRSDNIFNDNFSVNSTTFLLKNNLLKKILENIDKYISNNNFIYNDIKCCKLNKPIFLSSNDNMWSEYYNIINSYDRIYILHLNKDYDRLNNCLDICNIFNVKPKDAIWDGLLGINAQSCDELIKNNIIKINLKVGEIGCNLSQQYMLEDAKKNNYNRIMIFEDDCILSDNYFTNLYNLIKDRL